MARQKKCYNSVPKGTENRYIPVNGKGNAHQSRGGIAGKAVDSGFGSPTNLNKSKKNYRKAESAGGN